MAATPAKKEFVRVDFAFRRELAEKIEGNLASFCYQCGACVGDCPAMTYGKGFNPRDIMLRVLYGLGHELMVEDSLLWQCTNCYNCHERCPQEVKPVEVIISMKNMLADRGIYPTPVERVIATFESVGRTVPPSSAVDKQRERFGLPPMGDVPMDEIRELLRPEGEEGAVGAIVTEVPVGAGSSAAAEKPVTGEGKVSEDAEPEGEQP